MLQVTESPIRVFVWQGEQNFSKLYEFCDADNNYGVAGMQNGKGNIAEIRTPAGIIPVYPGDIIVKEFDSFSVYRKVHS